ncbi:glycosyltransferase family protein [Desulfonatronum thioautotrophicum]|uniref:glycosyltransferase family protein n=1 Tax=Desulfonatronum thioautotrophicum TaxID=617001 RepID=UPI00069B808D|nr:glycosyltransferase [Desulfonatronum thioautotrophicum]
MASDTQPPRPHRLQILDQLGRRKSLPDDPEQYQTLYKGNADILLLGVGPNPSVVTDLLQDREDVVYLECPELARQKSAAVHAALPMQWRAISCADLEHSGVSGRTVLFYRPGLSLFPDFWSSVLARIALQRFPPPKVQTNSVVWLPASEQRLLARELTWAFTTQGLTVRHVPVNMSPGETLCRLEDERPGVFFSVNFQGLDPLGQIHGLLRRAEVQVCVWCVDNPFHLLSGLRSAYWKKCRLFVTDDWFIPLLVDHGATQPVHLPLAAAEHFLHPDSSLNAEDDWSDLAQRMVFVGRSVFPGKERFFAGCAIPRELDSAAEAIMTKGERPDFAWWHRHLSMHVLWPGPGVRQIGFAAEEFSRRRRTAYLLAAQRTEKLTVFGDTQWRSLLPDTTDIRPEVDYYGPLAQIYRQARSTLNLTSLLLPHGLTQRHFDVWAANGILLTDRTPGLNVFDSRLTSEIAFDTPVAMNALMRRLNGDSSLCNDLRNAWRDHILKHHRYTHRVATVLETLASPAL